jgi:hypothetical protein
MFAPMSYSLAIVIWVGLALFAESPGALLSAGTRLVYTSGGQDSEWLIERIVRDTALGGMQNCSVIQLRTSAAQTNPEVRRYCEQDNVLYTWDAALQQRRALRPLSPGSSIHTRGTDGTTTSAFEAVSVGMETIGSHQLSVIATVVTTFDGAGRVTRRLRERFSPALATATGGVFEVPDSAATGGWRVVRTFELTRVTR